MLTTFAVPQYQVTATAGGASGNTKLATHAFRAPDRASFFLWVQPTLARILALPLFPALTPKPSSNSSPNLNQVDTLQQHLALPQEAIARQDDALARTRSPQSHGVVRPSQDPLGASALSKTRVCGVSI